MNKKGMTYIIATKKINTPERAKNSYEKIEMCSSTGTHIIIMMSILPNL